VFPAPLEPKVPRVFFYALKELLRIATSLLVEELLPEIMWL
jgi:hypothetical protein